MLTPITSYPFTFDTHFINICVKKKKKEFSLSAHYSKADTISRRSLLELESVKILLLSKSFCNKMFDKLHKDSMSIKITKCHLGKNSE